MDREKKCREAGTVYGKLIARLLVSRLSESKAVQKHH